MKKHRMLVPAVAVAAVLLGACGSDGGGDSFSEQLQTECRAISRELRAIDAPTQLADFGKAASDASAAYDTGLTALKKLKPPSKQADDFEKLQSNFEDQVDLFDQIGTAAKKGDSATVGTKITSLEKLTKDNVKLADSLDAKPCAFDPVFANAPTDATTTTKPAATTTTAAPATTVAPTTAAAATTTVAETLPPTTTAAAQGNKQVEPFADRLTPQGDISFVDTDATIIDSVRASLTQGPLYAAQSGTIGAVDLLDGNGTIVIRVFVFVTDADALTPGTLEEAENTVSGGAALTPATFGGIAGKTFPDPSGVTVFVAASGDTLLVAAGATDADLDQGISALVESLP
ncbi:MAG: hypothetical protein QM733_03250 [Ilumatobacteraceae bacterium]